MANNMDPSTEISYEPYRLAPEVPAEQGLPPEEETYELYDGQEFATEEEQMKLDTMIDTIENLVNGPLATNVRDTINSTPDLWMSVSHLTSAIVLRMAHKLDEQGIEDDSTMFFAENGVIQQTAEMLWDIAAQQGHPAVEDDEQFEAAYLESLRQIGEAIEMDEDSAREAQDALLELEMGEDVVGEAALQLQDAAVGPMSEPVEAAGGVPPAPGFMQ